MPDFLLKNVRNHKSESDATAKDIYIKDGQIQNAVPDILPENIEKIDASCQILFTNLIDLGTKISEPGHEYRETLEQTCKAAANGGFSAIVCFPNTSPAIDTKSAVEYVLSRSEKYEGVKILQIGALSKNNEGKELAEILEMNEAGAVAFSDGSHPVKSGGVLLRGLDYLRGIDKVIMSTPYDEEMFPKGLVHEGPISTLMGVPGIPVPAEEIIVNRDIELVRYSGGRIHLNCISTAGSVSLIRKAKSEGLNITCSVSVNNLIFSVEDVADYDSNLKLLPPLREREICDMLWDAVKDGTIDVITSQHMPYEPEKKDLEFPYASFGALGLQTAVIALLTKYGLEAAAFIQKAMSDNVIRIFGLENHFTKDVITLAAETDEVEFEESDLISNCYNSPFIGRKLKFKLSKIN
jgi:dihydroorotase